MRHDAEHAEALTRLVQAIGSDTINGKARPVTIETARWIDTFWDDRDKWDRIVWILCEHDPIKIDFMEQHYTLIRIAELWVSHQAGIQGVGYRVVS